MKAIILAAGLGTRMGPLAENKPKGLIELKEGKTVLEYSLENLSKCGLKEVIIVVGNFKEMIIKRLGNEFKGMKISYVINEYYAKTSTLGSLYRTKGVTNDDVIVLEGDLVYEPRVIKEALNDEAKNILVTIPVSGAGDQASYLYTDSEGNLEDIKKGPKHKQNAFGEMMGATKLSKEALEKVYEIAEAEINQGVLDGWYEEAFLTTSKTFPIKCLKGNFIWVNINRPEHIELAKEKISKLTSKAIILVAGMGTRLKPLTDNSPKCLTEINGKPILVNALEHLEKTGIDETILVVGYLKEKIKEKIGEQFGNMKISYVENNIYDKTNTSYSLWLAVKDLNVEDSLLVLEGDVFFEEQLLKQFVEDAPKVSTVVQKYNPDLDGSFVSLGEDGIVTDWIHKSHREDNFVIEDKFKTVNIHKFSKDFITDTFIPILKKHVEEQEGREPIEYVMRDVVKNTKVNSFKTGSLKWFEVDTVEELKIAENLFK